MRRALMALTCLIAGACAVWAFGGAAGFVPPAPAFLAPMPVQPAPAIQPDAGEETETQTDSEPEAGEHCGG